MWNWIKSNWPVVATLFLVAALLSVSASQQDAGDCRTESQEYASADQPKTSTSPASSEHDSFNQGNDHPTDEGHPADFLLGWSAEEIIAWGTLGLFFATLLLFAATYLLWRTTLTALRDARDASNRQAKEFHDAHAVSQKALVEAQRSNRISLDSRAAQMRPWIEATIEINGTLTWPGKHHGLIPLKVTLRNVGASPALKVVECFDSTIMPAWPGRITQEQHADRMRNMPTDNGVTIFQGREKIIEIDVPIRQSDIDANGAKWAKKFKGRNIYIVGIIGVIFYESDHLPNQRLETGVIRFVRKPGRTRISRMFSGIDHTMGPIAVPDLEVCFCSQDGRIS